MLLSQGQQLSRHPPLRLAPAASLLPHQPVDARADVVAQQSGIAGTEPVRTQEARVGGGGGAKAGLLAGGAARWLRDQGWVQSVLGGCVREELNVGQQEEAAVAVVVLLVRWLVGCLVADV